ncbi:hypothetical protein Hamer_G022335 [Homarus americanus]|uniref:Uncharacterized protein n=1 Tax=Homarus americanus TaxID=6706 RepID=A0A8J5MJQ9_HOMAM|nr:hypothetical protein Hamer_G022335 [Homarus americanus]
MGVLVYPLTSLLRRVNRTGTSGVERCWLETGVREIGVLETEILETGVLETELLETGVLETGVLETELLETGVLETGVLVETWILWVSGATHPQQVPLPSLLLDFSGVEFSGSTNGCQESIVIKFGCLWYRTPEVNFEQILAIGAAGSSRTPV